MERAELTCRVTWSTLSADGSRMLTMPRSVSTRIWGRGSSRASDVGSLLPLAQEWGPSPGAHLVLTERVEGADLQDIEGALHLGEGDTGMPSSWSGPGCRAQRGARQVLSGSSAQLTLAGTLRGKRWRRQEVRAFREGKRTSATNGSFLGPSHPALC